MIEGKPLVPEGSPFELWDVRLMSGDVKLSIDELDAAFESGLVDRNTLVRRRGTVRWVTLAEAANLGPSELEPAAAQAVPPVRRSTPPPLVVAPPTPHVSSLPPPVTVRTRDDSFPELENTAAAMAAIRPRSNRRRLLGAFFLVASIGGATATMVKVPSVRRMVVTAVHPTSAPAAVAAPPPPAASVALPAPSAAPSVAPAASSATKLTMAPAKPSPPAKVRGKASSR